MTLLRAAMHYYMLCKMTIMQAPLFLSYPQYIVQNEKNNVLLYSNLKIWIKKSL